jgi:hypothetical protein
VLMEGRAPWRCGSVLTNLCKVRDDVHCQRVGCRRVQPPFVLLVWSLIGELAVGNLGNRQFRRARAGRDTAGSMIAVTLGFVRTG